MKLVGVRKRACSDIILSEARFRTGISCLGGDRFDIQGSLKNSYLSVGVLNIVICGNVNAVFIRNGDKTGVVNTADIGDGAPTVSLARVSCGKSVLARDRIARGTDWIAVIGVGKVGGTYRYRALAERKSSVGVADSVVRAYVNAVCITDSAEEGILYLGRRGNACPIAKRHGVAGNEVARGYVCLLLGMSLAVIYSRIGLTRKSYLSRKDNDTAAGNSYVIEHTYVLAAFVLDRASSQRGCSRSYVCKRAFDRCVKLVAVNERAADYLEAFRSKRLTVIDLGRVVCGNGYRSFGSLDLTGYCYDYVAFSNVNSVTVSNSYSFLICFCDLGLFVVIEAATLHRITLYKVRADLWIFAVNNLFLGYTYGGLARHYSEWLGVAVPFADGCLSDRTDEVVSGEYRELTCPFFPVFI